jgi:hypothetical protein
MAAPELRVPALYPIEADENVDVPVRNTSDCADIARGRVHAEVFGVEALRESHAT